MAMYELNFAKMAAQYKIYKYNEIIFALSSEISVTETITETEIIHPTLTETETMVIWKTEIL